MTLVRREHRGGRPLSGTLAVLATCWLALPSCTLSDREAGTSSADANADANDAGQDATSGTGGTDRADSGDGATADSAVTGGGGQGATASTSTASGGDSGTDDGTTRDAGTGGDSSERGDAGVSGDAASGQPGDAGTSSEGGDVGTSDDGSTGAGGERGDARPSDDGGEGGDGPSCVGTGTDPENCGSCGRVCPAPTLAGAKAVCTAGQCGAACPPGTLGDGVKVCSPITTIAAGNGFTCGLLVDGHVKCWGNPDMDLNPSGLDNVLFESITAADTFVCGIRDNGRLYCWGTSVPTIPSGTFYAVAAGDSHVCAIQSNLNLTCWSILDNGTSSAPSGTYKLVSSGSDFSCAAIQGGDLDGRALCWGNGTDVTGDFPTTATTDSFTQLWAGGTTSWGLHADGSVHSWGKVMFSAPADTPLKTLDTGGENCCGIVKEDSSLTCWGIPYSDVILPPSGTFKAIAMGANHACGVKDNGDVACWGGNEYGQAPTTVSGPFQGWW